MSTFTLALSAKHMCVITVQCTEQCLGKVTASTCRTPQIGTHACDLACSTFLSASRSSSITSYNVLTLTLPVLWLAADPWQSNHCAASVRCTSCMPHRRCDISTGSTVIPTGSAVILMVSTPEMYVSPKLYRN